MAISEHLKAVYDASPEQREWKSCIVGLDAKTGKQAWRLDIPNCLNTFSTPVVPTLKSGKKEIICADTGSGVMGIDLLTGKLNWQHNPGYTQRSLGSGVLSDEFYFCTFGTGGGVKEVAAALRPGSPSAKKAESYGFKVMTVAEAAKWADVMMMAAPDELQASIWKNDLRDNMKPGAAIAFTLGLNIHFNLIEPRSDIDVFMIAPKGPIRADLVDFWRLLAENGVRLVRHYILYPNPCPKIGHLARRWHGHAVFPVWRELGGELECRGNWRIYIEEMARALTLLAGQPVIAEPYTTEDPITPFERKYLASGHELWRCRVDFG